MTDLGASKSASRPIVLVGAGVLGRRIACSFVAAGYAVHVRDLSQTALDEAVAFVEAHRDEYAQLSSGSDGGSGGGRDGGRDGGSPAPRGRCAAFTSLEEAVGEAWLVVEAIPEHLELKRELFGQLDGLAPADCIFATNSSSFKSSLLVGGLGEQRRRQLLNMHFSMLPHIRTVATNIHSGTAATRPPNI